MAGFTKSSPWGFFRSLFGDGASGDVTIATNTNLPSTLNGPIVERNYRNLTINAGVTLSVANPCKGLLIRVNGVLTLNGIIDMTGKGCYNPNPADLFLGYTDIRIPAIGAAAGQPVLNGNYDGNPGANGIDGQCGGAGAGASAFYAADKKSNGGAGSAGHCSGGGKGGGGGAADFLDNWHYVAGTLYNQATAAQPYGAGAGVQGSWRQVGERYPDQQDQDIIVGTGGVGASPSGGILIVMAREIVGNGIYRSNGSKGGDGYNSYGWTYLRNAGGGGSGAGSIVVYYQLAQSLNGQVLGGEGGQNAYGTGHKGGNGGNGSFRTWSLAQLASHPRL